ncbi:MAG: hypothetical protein ACI9NT_000618 [Bacteroidia bacterium]|jgi:hypothetical protein
MFISTYYSENDGRVSFTREQGSNFAKGIADDFNPLHDADAKRFCIPGDLLFTLLLSKYGLSQRMELTFSGMVPDGVELILAEPADEIRLLDAQDKEYLQLQRGGDNVRDEAVIESLCRAYVAFSGHTFPDLLVPLLAERNVMINPNRPMVMYQSMGIDMTRLDFTDVTLQLDHNELEIDGKRGAIQMVFNFLEGDDIVGRGRKSMLVSGLREYNAVDIEDTVNRYNASKESFGA